MSVSTAASLIRTSAEAWAAIQAIVVLRGSLWRSAATSSCSRRVCADWCSRRDESHSAMRSRRLTVRGWPSTSDVSWTSKLI
jgi:hypothetical protein